MTIYNGGLVVEQVFGGKLASVTIAGTVSSSGSPAIRDILVYKLPNNDLLVSTTSDAAGDFSIEVTGGSNDCFRVICVGIAGENSVIYEHVCS